MIKEKILIFRNLILIAPSINFHDIFLYFKYMIQFQNKTFVIFFFFFKDIYSIKLRIILFTYSIINVYLFCITH